MKSEVWFGIGKALNGAWFYDNIGNIFNYSCIALGFFGFFVWMRFQAKFNKEAENNTNQIK